MINIIKDFALNYDKKSRHKKTISERKQELNHIKKEEAKIRAEERATYLESISLALSVSPDVFAGAPIMTLQGRTSLLIENYKKITEYTGYVIKIQTRQYTVQIQGNDLCIAYYTKDEMKITGIIHSIVFS